MMTLADHIAAFQPKELRPVLAAHYLQGRSKDGVQALLKTALQKLGRPVADVALLGRELFAVLETFEREYIEAGDYDEPKVAAMDTETAPPLQPGEIRLGNGLTFQVDLEDYSRMAEQHWHLRGGHVTSPTGRSATSILLGTRKRRVWFLDGNVRNLSRKNLSLQRPNPDFNGRLFAKIA